MVKSSLNGGLGILLSCVLTAACSLLMGVRESFAVPRLQGAYRGTLQLVNQRATGPRGEATSCAKVAQARAGSFIVQQRGTRVFLYDKTYQLIATGRVEGSGFEATSARFGTTWSVRLRDGNATFITSKQVRAAKSPARCVVVRRGRLSFFPRRTAVPGKIQFTGRDFDVAIDGEGFFQVSLPDGSDGYTRLGRFQVSEDGMLTTSGGLPVVPPIQVPSDALSVTIGEDGLVQVLEVGQSTPSTVGRIEGARFSDVTGLQLIEKDLFVQTNPSNQPIFGQFTLDGFGKVVHRHLER